QVLRPLWHDKPETLSRVRARIASVLDYAKAAGYRTGDNPASWDIVGKLLPARARVAPVNHLEALDYHDVPAFVTELRKREGSAARALEFAILPGARGTEAREATWGEIASDEKLLRVPRERMKGAREHVVPLAPEALELLRGLYREGDSNDGLLFLGPQPGKPLSEAALRAVMRRMGRTEGPHGFRSSFSDWAGETTGYANHVIELSLAHSIGTAVERAYRRRDMIKKRRRLMADWARYCLSPPAAAGEVEPMRARSWAPWRNSNPTTPKPERLLSIILGSRSKRSSAFSARPRPTRNCVTTWRGRCGTTRAARPVMTVRYQNCRQTRAATLRRSIRRRGDYTTCWRKGIT